MRTTTSMRKQLRGQLAGLAVTLEKINPARPRLEAVHRARVACRTLRDSCAAFPGAPLAPLVSEASRLKAALGQLRDLQLRGARGPTLEDATAGARRAIGRWRKAQPGLSRQLGTAQVKGHLGGRRTRHVLHRRLLHLGAWLDAFPRGAPAIEAHLLRRKIKRARAVVEVLSPDDGLKSLSEALAAAARALGDLHDLDVGLTRGDRRPLERKVAAALATLRRELAMD